MLFGGDQGNVESIKRGRTDYAETLRKKRREEHQKAKRQNKDAQTGMTIGAPSNTTSNAGGLMLPAQPSSQVS